MILRRIAWFVVLGTMLAGYGYSASAVTCTNRDYCVSSNPFYPINGGQCTAYAWGRAYEKMNIAIQFSQNAGRNANQWYTLVKDLPRGRQIQSNSIAVFAGDSRNRVGHVAYVEEVKNGTVYFSEANVNTFKDTNYGGGYDGYTKNLSISQFESRGTGVGNIVGYIYLSRSPTLSKMTLACPSSVNENNSSAGVCTATAYYTDNSSKTVTPSSWSDNSSALSISSNGTISTTSVSADARVTVQGIYSEGGRTVDAMATFTLKDIPSPFTQKVTSVSPTVATYGQKTTFTVQGTGLTSSLAFWIDQCAYLSSTGGSSTMRTFTCTPSYSRGVKSGVVKNSSGGITLQNFTITVK